MGITKDVVVRIVKVTFLSWSANHPYFLSKSDRKAGISTQIRLKPLYANALMINQQALFIPMLPDLISVHYKSYP